MRHRVGVTLPLLLTALCLVAGCDKQTPPKRQVARISVLPDTPPPPPPPPKIEKPPEPKEPPKAVPREEPQRTPEPPKPAEAPLKMEGATGTGPSAFAAGSVSKDYQGGAVASTAASGAGGGSVTDRAQERFYASTARQLLRDELDRRLGAEAPMGVAQFSLWIAADGAIRRFELQPSGNEQADGALRLALDDTVRQLRLPPPPPAIAALNQPMRFRLTLRAAG